MIQNQNLAGPTQDAAEKKYPEKGWRHRLKTTACPVGDEKCLELLWEIWRDLRKSHTNRSRSKTGTSDHQIVARNSYAAKRPNEKS